MRKNSVGNRFPAGVPVISLGVSAVSVVEGQTLTVNINRTASALTSTCRFYTIPRSAGNSDYVPHEGTLVTFAAGETNKQVTVTISNDLVSENDETFYVQIANPNMASIGEVNRALVTITGQAQVVTVASVSSPSVTEGNPIEFNVVLSGTTTQSTQFSFVASGTATPNVDYNAAPTLNSGVTLSGGQITVPNGVSVFKVTYATINDTAIESPETIVLNVGGVQGIGTINSDDNAITSVLSVANVMEGLPLVFNVTLSGASAQAQTFAFSRTGTAAAGSDFTDAPTFTNGVTLSSGQVNVPSGVTSFTVTYPTINDALDEPEETIVLTIGGVSGTGIILSDDGVLAAYSTRLIEAPYYLLTAPQRSGLAANDGYVHALVERNIGGLSSPNYNLRVSSNNSTFTAIGDANYAPTGYLLNPASKTVESFTLSSAVDMADIVFTGNKVLGFIGNEVVECTAWNDATKVLSVRRGVADSVPEKHLTGAKIYIAVANIGKDPTEYVSGNILYYKALPKSGGSTYAEASAVSSEITLAGRASRPYPPNMFMINGEYYPADVDGGDITISWQPRNRITQIADLIDYKDVLAGEGGGSPETIVISKNTGADNAGIEDTYIQEYNAANNYVASEDFKIDEFTQQIVTLSALNAYAGRTITAVSFEWLAWDTDAEFILNIGRLTRPVVMEEANYTESEDGVSWTNGSGGLTLDVDLGSVVTFSDADKDGSIVTITGSELVALFQELLDEGNHGLAFGYLTEGCTGYANGSSSDADDGDRPVITITFAGEGGEVEGEEGTTHTLQVFNIDEMVREVTGIEGNEYVYTDANIIADGDYDNLTVKLFSVVDGLPSWTAQEHNFTRPFTGVPTPTAINISGGVEGGNAIFTVTMSGPYHDQVDHGFEFGGDYDPEDIGTITYSDDVEDNGDETLAVPAGVDEFTVTIPILTDALAETGENITLTMGEITATINLTNP